MKIVMIHGQNHAGSTCMVARELAHKVGGEIREFFLPRDFDEPCLGCYTCFQADLTHCPHYQKLEPVLQTIEAFTRNTNKVVYVVDYLKKNFLYSSDNIEELCGITKEEMLEMGYLFHSHYVPREESSASTTSLRP